MEVFCHPLSKPAGSLHVKAEGSELDLTIVLKDRVVTAEVSIAANPEAKQLLEPCDSLEVILQKNKLTVLANGRDVARSSSLAQSDSRQVLTNIIESFCELSRAHAEALAKRREARDVREEAFECLKKIEQQHQEDFTKFILILNEKKKRIRELQKKLGIGTGDPADIDDDIGVEILSDGPSQSKRSRVSDQLAVEGPPASSSTAPTRDVDELDEGAEEVEDVEDVDDELFSDEEHTDGAQSEPEEIEEDDPPVPEISISSTVEQEARVEEAGAGAIEAETKAEKMSFDENKNSETDPPSPTTNPQRSTQRITSPKKSSLDLLDDLL